MVLLTALWVMAEPNFFQPANFFAFRGDMVQWTGVIGMALMSIAMMLALRPTWPERWLGGLDKMYRLHKWLGISALVFSVVHWLWAKGPKWAVGWGLLERPHRGPRPEPDTFIEQVFSGLRHTAEGMGEWAFYAAVALILLALIKLFPYRLFAKVHRVLPVAYLVLAFHSVVLTDFVYWIQPVGLVQGVLLLGGTWAALLVLLRQIGSGRKATGRIATLHYYPVMHALRIEVDLPQGWKGHQAGQFAFLTCDPAEGAHPFTIASAWDAKTHRVAFVVKELGDHTRTLRETLRVGQAVTVEGPYGDFTFDDQCPRQVWIGGGIGITPFLARLGQLATQPGPRPQSVDLFHAVAAADEDAIARLTAEAKAAGVRLHVLVEKTDGRLSGERIRQMVGDWKDASIWFCGPAGFGQALRQDFAAQGLPVGSRFHQELFAMR